MKVIKGPHKDSHANMSLHAAGNWLVTLLELLQIKIKLGRIKTD